MNSIIFENVTFSWDVVDGCPVFTVETPVGYTEVCEGMDGFPVKIYSDNWSGVTYDSDPETYNELHERFFGEYDSIASYIFNHEFLGKHSPVSYGLLEKVFEMRKCRRYTEVEAYEGENEVVIRARWARKAYSAKRYTKDGEFIGNILGKFSEALEEMGYKRMEV